MTFDRFYSILKPHKAASFNTVKRAKVTIICIVILSVLFNIPNLFMTEHEGRRCVPYVTGRDKVYGEIYYWLSFTVNFILPFIMLLIMNNLIIHVIRKSSNFRNERDSVQESKGQAHVQGQNSKVKNSEKQVYAILLLVTFGFMIFITPSYIFFVYVMLFDYIETPKSFAFFHLFHHFAHKTFYTNYGINFYLYVISGGKFRADLMKLFGCNREKENKNSSKYSSESVTRNSSV